MMHIYTVCIGRVDIETCKFIDPVKNSLPRNRVVLNMTLMAAVFIQKAFYSLEMKNVKCHNIVTFTVQP